MQSSKTNTFNFTLTPPSPVSTQINVQLRAGIANHSGQEQMFDVSFYLDHESQEHLLHHTQVSVTGHQSACVEFSWPTTGQAGRHMLTLVVKTNGLRWSQTRPLQVQSFDHRSTKRIDGAFCGLLHWSDIEGRLWNQQLQTMTDQDWREMVRGYHELEMNIIVLQEALRNQQYVGKHNIEKEGYHGKAFYPSRLFPGRVEIGATDPIESILSQADELGMHVFMPVGMYAWFDFTPGSLMWHKNVAQELWDLYGHHDSFYGWYISEEIPGNLGTNREHREQIVDFFAGFKQFCQRLTPGKPLMLASNSHGVPEAREYYPDLLKNLDIICPFGFHRMPKGDLTGPQAANLLQEMCDQTGAHLWLDLEAFLFHPDTALYPRPIEGVIEDLERYVNFEKIICYQYPGLFNAPWARLQPGGPDTVKLFENYKDYVQSLEAVCPSL